MWIKLGFILVSQSSNKPHTLVCGITQELCDEKFRRAKKVLLIGGGIVGVELAAEIATHCKDKEVTLVHS